jgi:predicted DCC family thiol-disulfide oxidoreductase YuxK
MNLQIMQKVYPNISSHSVPIQDKPIIIFDGNCAFCRRCIRFIKKNDQRNVFEYTQREDATALLQLTNHQLLRNVNSVYLIVGNQFYAESEAVIRILKLLGRKWRILAALIALFPTSIRNRFYRMVARNRHQISCYISD